MKLLDKLLRREAPEKPEVSGITIFLLQRTLERFTSERLCLAMQRGWRKPYDEVNFYGMSTFNGDGGLLKMDAMFFTMQHFNRRVDASCLGEREVPAWAAHNACTSFGYRCPGGIPHDDFRDKFCGFLGLICAELVSAQTTALVFSEDQILLECTPRLIKQLRSGMPFNAALFCKAL